MIEKISVFFLLWFFALISSYILYKTPVFGDGVSYVRKIEYTISKWRLDMIDPIWYTDFFINNPEKPPLSYQPIYFFSLWVTSALIIWNIQLAIDIFNILALLWTIFLVFRLLLLISKNRSLALVGICFFSLSSMQYRLISHRLIDPILNFLILFFVYLLIKYKGKKELLLVLFSVVIVNLKITGALFLIIIWSFYVFYYFIRNKDKAYLLCYIWIGIVLLIPFLLFYKNQTLSWYPFPSTNINFQSEIQKQLNIDSNAVKIVQDYWIKDSVRLDRLENYLLDGKLWGIIQFFAVFKTNNSSQKDHDFGVINVYAFFLLAVIFYLMRRRKSEKEWLYNTLLIWFFLLALILNQLVALARYSYFINIIFYSAFFIGSWELFKQTKIFILLYFILLLLQTDHNISDNINYYYSIDHNPTRSVGYSFTDDFNLFEKTSIYAKMTGSECVFSNSRDFAFRSKIMKKRDSRLFSLGKEKFIYYYNKTISCDYVVVSYFDRDIITQLGNAFWNPIYLANTFLIFKVN